MEFVLTHVHAKFRFKGATICREQVVTGVIGGIVIAWILLILSVLEWSEVENEICPLMVPEVWAPEPWETSSEFFGAYRGWSG